jgi:hypothetical protein
MRQVFRQILIVAVLGLSVTAALGQNATWLLSPGSSDFNTGTNWSPPTAPTGTAIFGASNTTSLTFSTNTTIGSMQFNAGGPAYSFAVSSAATPLEFNGAGIVNNSANAPTISNTGGGQTFFENASTAGNAIITTNGAGSAVEFANASTAGSASITNNTSFGAFFINTSTAGNALSGNNSYTGATTVNGGTLDVTGSIAASSLTSVNAGGSLTSTEFSDASTV